MANEITCPQLTLQAQQYIQETAQPQPKHFCTTCTKLRDGNYCNYFQRRVEANYNRCFNHSNYSPVVASFKAPTNLEEIIKKEEEKQIA